MLRWNKNKAEQKLQYQGIKYEGIICICLSVSSGFYEKEAKKYVIKTLMFSITICWIDPWPQRQK